jgi:hypothetical protein
MVNQSKQKLAEIGIFNKFKKKHVILYDGKLKLAKFSRN